MCDLDMQRSTANAGGRAGRIYPQSFFPFLIRQKNTSID